MFVYVRMNASDEKSVACVVRLRVHVWATKLFP